MMTGLVIVLALCLLLSACIPGAPCTLTPNESATVYNRPSAVAGVFGMLGAGENVEAAVKTADGFYGFDPGVAQAGNVGVFRNRWILKTYQVEVSGNCAGVETVVGPITDLCYAMSMGDTPVYTDADTASALVTTLHLGDYAHALERASGWVRVDLNVGDPMMDATGWIQEGGIGYNGDCGGL